MFKLISITPLVLNNYVLYPLPFKMLVSVGTKNNLGTDFKFQTKSKYRHPCMQGIKFMSWLLSVTAPALP